MGLDMDFLMRNKKTGEEKELFYFGKDWPLFHTIEKIIGSIENGEKYVISPETMQLIKNECRIVLFYAYDKDLYKDYFHDDPDDYDYLPFIEMIRFVRIVMNDFKDFDKEQYEIIFWPDW